MHGLTVRDVLQLPIMKEAQCLTQAGFQNPVEWASIVETAGKNFVRKNECVLTLGIAFQHDEQKCLDFTKDVIASGAAALVIATGLYVQTIPNSLIAFCERHHFPLITIPWYVRFADVSHAISVALNEKEKKIVQSSDKVRKKLLDFVLNGEGFQAIASYVEQSLQLPTIVTDRRGVIVTTSALSPSFADRWNAHLLRYGDPLYYVEEQKNTASPPLHHMNMHWIAREQSTLLQLTIQSAREVLGFLVIEWPHPKQEQGGIEEETFTLLEHALTSLALCFLHDKTAKETELRLKDDFVWNLAQGKYHSHKEAITRAKSFGYRLNIPYLCIVATIENGETVYEQQQRKYFSFDDWLDQWSKTLEQEVYLAGRTLHMQTMSTFQHHQLIIFLEVMANNPMESAYPFIELFQYRLHQKNPHLLLSWGIAKTCEKYAFHTSYEEATAALESGRRHHHAGFIHTYEDTQLDRALLALLENDELKKMTEVLLAPLLKYSVERKINLIHTFQVYSRHNCNVSKTARALNLHRQSLLYRLRKIESLTGLKLDNADDLFLMELAIRLHSFQHANKYPSSSPT